MPKPTKAQAKQARIQKQIMKLLKTFREDRVFSAHDMAAAMREVWSRTPNHREVAHALVRLGDKRIITRARHAERMGIAGNTNMWQVNPVWLDS